MTGYLIRRLVQSIIVVFGVVLLTFLLAHLYPQNAAARAALGPKASAVTKSPLAVRVELTCCQGSAEPGKAPLSLSNRRLPA